jgi:hypothetical protein
MVMFAIVSVLLGLVLAQRFKVFVLLPVILLVLTFALARAFAHVEAAVISAVTVVIAIVSLQIGYLLGAAVRYAVLLARTHRLSAASLRRLPQSRAHQTFIGSSQPRHR